MTKEFDLDLPPAVKCVYRYNDLNKHVGYIYESFCRCEKVNGKWVSTYHHCIRTVGIDNTKLTRLDEYYNIDNIKKYASKEIEFKLG